MLNDNNLDKWEEKKLWDQMKQIFICFIWINPNGLDSNFKILLSIPNTIQFVKYVKKIKS